MLIVSARCVIGSDTLRQATHRSVVPSSSTMLVLSTNDNLAEAHIRRSGVGNHAHVSSQSRPKLYPDTWSDANCWMGEDGTPAYTPTAAVANRTARHARPSLALAGCADTLVCVGVGGGMHMLCVLQDLITQIFL